MKQSSNTAIEQGKLRRAQDCARLRWHHGLGTSIALVLIFSLVMNYIVPSRLPYTEAATTTKTWSADADFNNNNVTGEGSSTIVQATTTGAGAVRLNLVGTSTVSEAFSNETNFNTGSSSAIVSGGSLKIGSSSWTQTDWTAGSGSTSTATGFSTSTSISTSSGAFTKLSSSSAATWYNSSWTKRRKLTINNASSAENLTNFPILVRLSSSTNFSFSGALSAGQDIRFTDTDGTTLLDYEIESWASSTTGAWIWVKVPQIDSASTTESIFIYYGNSGASDAQTATSVWSNNYRGVWHLSEDPSGSTPQMQDSTANNNDLSTQGSMTAGDSVSAQIGKGLDFDGVDDTATTTSGVGMPTSTASRTVEGWVYPTAVDTTEAEVLISYRKHPTSGQGFTFYGDGNQLFGDEINGGNNIGSRSNGPTTSVWTYLALTYKLNGANHEWTYYENGGFTASGTFSVAIDTEGGNHITIARRVGGALWFTGILDEVRISTSSRSADWIEAEYKSMTDALITTYGAQEIEDATTATLASNIFDTKFVDAGATWGTASYTTDGNGSSSVKVRTGTASDLSGATAFASCTRITSGADISSNSCVTDGQRYIQYQVILETSSTTPTFQDMTINFTPSSGVYRGESATLDSLGTNIRFARLDATSTPGTGSISYYLSNDAGTNWSTTTTSTVLTFSTTTGSALRWRVDLTGNATVEDVSLDYNGYYATGTIRNLKIDANGDATWNTISWNVTAPAGTEAKFRTRGTNVSEGESALSTATWSSYYATSTNSATITSSSANPIFRWLEVELFLGTGTSTAAGNVNGGNTPSVEDFSLEYVINGPPQFDATYGTQGQTVEQLATSSEDNWGKVRIIYSVRDTDTASGTFPLKSTSTSFDYRLLSSDSWTAITNATLNSGASSSKTMSETVYSTVTRTVSATSTNAIWDAKTQIGQIYSTSVQIRVTVNDGDSSNNTSSSISAAFTLDTANPTSTTFRLDSSTSTNDVDFSFTDNTNIQYRFSSTSLTTSSDAVAWVSAGATSASGSSTVSGGFGGNTSSGEIVYFQVRDSFANYTTSSATAPGITGDNETRITLKDTSNPTIGNYREFVSWRAYFATSGATFSAYEVWRSTTTESAYTLLTSITDSATNYYTDSAVSNGTTYYYKVRFKDTDADYSAFSASTTDKVDGQGGTDVVQPTITSIATSTVQTTWATVTWTTDELASSAVRVGTSAGSYNTTSTLSNVFKTSHSETVSGLASGTVYYFQVRSTDSSANEKTDSNGSSDYTFKTLSGPTITGVAIKGVQDATATIRWATDVAATSAVRYSVNSNLSSASNLTSSSQVSGERELEISSLTGSTLYYFEVRSTASSGAVETIENNRGSYYSFRTTNDTTPPTISDIAVPVKTTASATITWSTNEPATSQVEWGTTSGTYPSSTTKSNTLTKNHSQTITGLTRETTYYFRVKSQDGNPSSAETVSGEQSFITPTPETVTVTKTETITTVSGGGGSRSLPVDSTPPVIKFVTTAKVGAFEALVTFVTNESAVSFVDYGQTTEYGQLAANKVFSEIHEVKLKNLRMGTNYNYRVKAVDKGGNDAFSENFTFRTPYLAEQVSNLVAVDNLDNIQSEIESVIETIIPSVVPPFIEEPKVSSSTETSAVVTWKTNIPAYSIVSYVPDEGYDMLAVNPYKSEVSQTEKKVKEHQMELTSLRSNTKYHYQVKSFSLPKAIGSSPDQTFVTKASKIEPKVVSIKKNSVTVSWFTDEPATSIVEYTDLKTGATKRVIETRQDTAHSIQIENLTPDTPYRIETLGVNRKGNTVEAEKDLTVRTEKDVIAPEVTSLNISNTLIPGRTDLVQTTISWKTNEPASSIIEYQEGATRTGDTLEKREEKPNIITTDHSFILTKLQPGKIYQIRSLSEDEAGNIGSSPIRMIVTPRQSESIFDIVIRNFEDSFQFVRKLR